MLDLVLIVAASLTLAAFSVAIIGVVRAFGDVTKAQSYLLRESAKMLQGTEEITRKNNIALIQGLRVCQQEMLEYARMTHVRSAFGTMGVAAVADKDARSLLKEEIDALCQALDLTQEQAVAWLRSKVPTETPAGANPDGTTRT